ncbi:MAG: hypothetical protein HUJ75_03730, partial [Parasporobacterium sp.]|nr:hypothetical protein [Parasporobacterium sp.]
SQLDDMAQMIGSKLPVVKNDAAAIAAALNKCDAVTVQGVGIFVNSAEKDDAEALALLAAKSAITKLQADALGVKGTLSAFDCILMRTVYKMKYSKKKNA